MAQNVNPVKTAELNQRLFQLQSRKVAMNDLSFFKEFEAFIEKHDKWYEEGGTIYFSVTADAIAGSEWIHRLEKRGCRIHVPELLESKYFKPLSQGKINVAVLKGGDLFNDQNRTIDFIRGAAYKDKLSPARADIACLIREKFTDDEISDMGLTHIIVMHAPIKGTDSKEDFLVVDIATAGGHCLNAYNMGDYNSFPEKYGFAFIV